MKRFASLVAAFAVAFAGMAVVASPAQAASTIQFGRIQYDAPGTPDNNTNASVNGEYVVIWNHGATARSLTGWTVRDRAGHIYRFGTFTLGAHKYTVIRTGIGTNAVITKYWGKRWHVWNNTGDAATLRTAGNVTVDSCSWSSRGAGYRYC